MFTDAEIRFLMQSHPVEHATTGRSQTREMPATADLRQIGCPEKIFFRVLEDRARRLGSKFTEFRAAQRAVSAQVAPSPGSSLESEIQAAKLF